jgi:ABC-2 type transport system ATP-binding protein
LQRIADYICFINQGRIVFCEELDKLLNRYVLVKGPGEILNEETRFLFTGIRRHTFGFEALSDRSQEISSRWGEQIVMEKASLEDIMLCIIRGNKHD